MYSIYLEAHNETGKFPLYVLWNQGAFCSSFHSYSWWCTVLQTVSICFNNTRSSNKYLATKHLCTNKTNRDAVSKWVIIIIIIIMMYIYHALINSLSPHMIHNLNMIFYTHVEHRPTKTIYIKYYTKKKRTINTRTHTDCSRNWVLILVRMEILWEGFQFGLKRWQGWAVSKVLWEWIPNVGSKAREGAKAMSQRNERFRWPVIQLR